MKNGSTWLKLENSRNVFLRSWHPENNTEPKGVILIAHGYAEHSGRYDYTAEFFTSRQYTVYAPDHYGNGKSDGVKADVPNFNIFVDDVVVWKVQKGAECKCLN